ncbi:MAG: thiamine diphosphokinase [Bacteroidetes bacterium]|nr:thiamine diphosphokinase [Bacteroidota bacterium]
MKHSFTQSALILANGDPPSLSLFKRIRRDHSHFLCADGGANTAARFGFCPDLIIGDLDSVTPAALKKCRNAIVLRVGEQDSTDLEKALAWCVRQRISSVVVLGATGGRLDHSIGNLSALAKFSARLEIGFADVHCEILPVRSARTIHAPKGTVISLLPLVRCSGISTTGLRWNLRNETLALGQRESTSNVVDARRATIRVKRGTLLLCVIRRQRGAQ